MKSGNDLDDDEMLQIFGDFEFGGCGKVIFAVFQISEGSPLKNPTRSATWPDKLIQNL